MQQSFGKFLMFRNRLLKVYRHLSKAAGKSGISCYRIYDADVPEAPFIIERYEDCLYVSEYKRNHMLDEEGYGQWLQECLGIMEEVTGVPPARIFLKLRKRKEGRVGQYQKIKEGGGEFIVRENGLKFIINGTDYLDTGLFLDHRLTRQMVRAEAGGKRLLNLFCYTGSFSVYGIAGGAVQVISVDLSNTYLAWSERNIVLNFPDCTTHQTVRADVKQYLKTAPAACMDIIVMDPPTFSNSKRMNDFLDVQQDHATLINDCLRLLTPAGVLYFSTNYRQFVLEGAKLEGAVIKDITKATTPFDFAGKLHRPCYKISRRDAL